MTLLDAPSDPEIALRLALRYAAIDEARGLARSKPGSLGRINARISLIETLKACDQYVGEWFWRDVVASVRETMEREVKS